MLEKIGDNDVIIRNYTENMAIKEYLEEVLIAKAFPDLILSNSNLSLNGIHAEYVSQGIEDSVATAALMMNESFITKAQLPSSIYAHGALFELGYTFATPAVASFALQLNLDDVLEFAQPVPNTSTMRYILDRDTAIVIDKSKYRPNYDIYIDFTYIDGKRVFNVYYNTDEPCVIANNTTKFIKHAVTSIGWLVLFVNLQQFDRKIDDESITDNTLTTNSDIILKWVNQIAGLDLIYISPSGQRLPMKLKPQYTKADTEPFAWYHFIDDYTIALSFCSNEGYWAPEFNSKVEYTIYTCNGKSANFNSYNSKTALDVTKGERYSYNDDTRMNAFCYSASVIGADKGDIEQLRDDIHLAYTTTNVLTTDNDLQMWFENYAKRYGTKATFFKRRDDPSGRLFSQFIAITDDSYMYPTNTLNIVVQQAEADIVNYDSNGNANEFIIKPGHLWEYNDTENSVSRNTVKMIPDVMISDTDIPVITDSRPFIFVNPFFIRIYRDPNISQNYNYLIDHTSMPEDEITNTTSFYQFQLAQFSIERTLSNKHNNMYHIEVICVPTVTSDTSMEYVESLKGETEQSDNNLRLVLVCRTDEFGDTGYIEMTPVTKRSSGSYVFACDIAVTDNLRSDMLMEVDLNKTSGMISLITDDRENSGKVFIDAEEASFSFICLMDDPAHPSTTTLYDNPTYAGYMITNRFRNDHRSLVLYNPMTMMRSTISFEGSNGSYVINASMIPMLRYDIPLDEEKMKYFVTAFSTQYAAMKPVLNKLNGNDYIDMKLYNTYGRSSNYYIGPMDGDPVLRNSTLLLDNVYVNVKLRIAVYDRSLYTQTVLDVKNEIIKTFEALNSDNTDIHASDVIHNIYTNHPNVKYIRFLGFNDRDANMQSIFIKYPISDMNQYQLQNAVPEIIRADIDSIEITEEV